MHAMFKPENLYAMPRELVIKQVAAHCERLDSCKSWEEFYSLSATQHWMLAAIYHSGLDFDTFDCILRNAINSAEDRLGETE